MKAKPHFLFVLLLALISISCHTDRDDEITPPSADNPEIENFIYSAMNLWYLYKPNVPVLADDRFETQDELNNYLLSFDSPEDLFYNGLKAPRPLDRFSIITADYRELERSFAGISLNNGMDFSLARVSDTRAIGIVRYVLPNTSAEAEGIERGMIFTLVDGNPLELNGNSLTSASSQLLAQNSYTIALAEITQDGIVETGETITLTKAEYTENPVFINKTFDNIGGQKVGYLMYNSFTANFDAELNAAFAELKSEGITELILDLRYNGGGSVRTATDLSAMITGQFAGELFAQRVYNPQVQAALEANPANDLNNYFNTETSTGDAINSLNLNKVYVITTGSTASASELVINGLDPYIDVQQVGDTTTGKFQASVTLYDSPDFTRQEANPNHFYAIQPLILTTANANGTTGFVEGLLPEIALEERVSTFGVLGDENEPLLKATLDEIRGNRSYMNAVNTGKNYPQLGESGMEDPTYQRMYTELPQLQK